MITAETTPASKLQKPFLDLQGWLLGQPFFTSKVLPKVPRRLRWGLRRLYFAPLDLIDRSRGGADSMIPPFSERFTGYSGDDFLASGWGMVDVLVATAGLDGTSAVLDIGSGIGRVAIPLTEVIVPPGSYDGLDIVERGINWCQERIGSRFPHFRFTHSDVANTEYNPTGTVAASEYKLPYPDETFDVVCLFSVFTHMVQADMEQYVSEIARVLKRGGRCAASYLILNDETVASMRTGKANQYFHHHDGPMWLLEAGMKAPELSVGYDEEYLRQLFAAHGFDMPRGIYYGPWSGLPARSNSGEPLVENLGQDLVVAVKV